MRPSVGGHYRGFRFSSGEGHETLVPFLASFASFVVFLLGISSVADPPKEGPKEESLVTASLSIHDDIPWLEVRVNGSAPLWFILDSGAGGCVLDLKQCQALGLPTEGHAKGTGAGAGTYDVTFARDLVFTVGTLKTSVDRTQVIDLSGVTGPEGKKLAGLLGYDFFERRITVIDYAQERLTIHDPKTFDARGLGESVSLVLKRRVPFVKGKLAVAGGAASEREWLVDTGSGDFFNDEALAGVKDRKEATGGRGLGKEFQISRRRRRQPGAGPFPLPPATRLHGRNEDRRRTLAELHGDLRLSRPAVVPAAERSLSRRRLMITASIR